MKVYFCPENYQNSIIFCFEFQILKYGAQNNQIDFFFTYFRGTYVQKHSGEILV